LTRSFFSSHDFIIIFTPTVLFSKSSGFLCYQNKYNGPKSGVDKAAKPIQGDTLSLSKLRTNPN